MALSIRAELESLLHADGFGHTLPSRIVLNHPRTDRLPIGLPELDTRLGGGVPVGALTEVTGGVSSGRTGVIVSLLAETLSRDEVAAYIDASETFDPATAASRGVPLARLLWVRCQGRVEIALKAADAVVRGNGLRVVVLDLGDLPSRALRRIPLAAYRRLQRAVERTSTALVLLADHPVAGTSAMVTVELHHVTPIWSGHHPTFRLFAGLHGGPFQVTGRGIWGQQVG